MRDFARLVERVLLLASRTCAIGRDAAGGDWQALRGEEEVNCEQVTSPRF